MLVWLGRVAEQQRHQTVNLTGPTLRRCKSCRAHSNMYYIYILLSEQDKQLYVGYTSDLKMRIEKHVKGFVPSTKFRRPLKLIHYESYLEMSDAKRREKFLKGGRGHNELKIQLRDVLKRLGYKNL